jgi:hypothetical protein
MMCGVSRKPSYIFRSGQPAEIVERHLPIRSIGWLKSGQIDVLDGFSGDIAGLRAKGR